jgi:hypothetical protein
MTRGKDHGRVSGAPPLERAEKVRDVLSAGKRLLSDLDEQGLSLAAAHLSMSLDMVVIEDRGRSSTH